MFKKMLVVLLFIATACFAGAAFTAGWESGYKAGYCYRVFGCLSPLVPLAPLPPLGEDTYMGGYNAGFLAGLAAQ